MIQSELKPDSPTVEDQADARFVTRLIEFVCVSYFARLRCHTNEADDEQGAIGGIQRRSDGIIITILVLDMKVSGWLVPIGASSAG